MKTADAIQKTVAIGIAVLVLCLILPASRGGERRDEPDRWDRFVDEAEAEGEAQGKAAAFLRAHRPARDADIEEQILTDTIEYALRAREEFPWARDIPVELFHNDVLPYASLDETRENWRPAMYERCRGIVQGCTTATEAAQAINRELFNKINVHYNTGRKAPNQSPAESVAQGRATCTGLSIILVDACRSVGIPARVAGVANWHNKRGNHTWVEIWDGGWHFTGADEYNKNGLNRGWFTGDASKAIAGSEEHAVWATSWAPTGDHFPMVWNRDDTTVHGVDVTERYTTKKETVKPAQATYIRLFDTRSGQRIIGSVATAQQPDASVTTKADTADLNDMPSLATRPGKPARLLVTHGDEQRVALLVPADASTRTVELYWDELGLSREAAERFVTESAKVRGEAITVERADEIDSNAFTVGTHTLKILEKNFGDTPPRGGRSLWISMHGGGGAPAEVNDKQWQNQIKLYEPEEGIYIAPRAPTDTWNLWHQSHIDALFDRLIETYIATRGVNPDKVYLMGYSAGGDGVYQLAPRMADRFAAASMMAGHPNETKPLGLRNLPFAVLMGGEDGAYDRNKKAAHWRDALAELQAADPEGYPHEVKIYEGLGHWMKRRDAEILPWMASHSRNAWPTKVVWHQDDVTHDRFYWLAVEDGDATPRSTIRASVTGNAIDIEAPTELSRLRLRLRDRLVDLDKPVTVRVNGKRVHKGRVLRTQQAIARSLAERNDPALAATAELLLEWTNGNPEPDAPSDP